MVAQSLKPSILSAQNLWLNLVYDTYFVVIEMLENKFINQLTIYNFYKKNAQHAYFTVSV